MKISAVSGGIALTIALLTIGCRRENSSTSVIWIGNADLSEYNEVVADFSNAFASDPMCQGIRIETHDFPKETYWFLETYPSDRSDQDHQFSDGISWWMLRHDHSKDVARWLRYVIC